MFRFRPDRGVCQGADGRWDYRKLVAMPKWSARAGAIVAFGALVLGSAVLVGVPSVSAAPTDDGLLRTLNTGGGTTAADGLQVSYASGQLEVTAGGAPQLATTGLAAGSRLATGNHIALAVGDTIVSDVLAETGAGVAWDRISTSQSYGTIFSTLTPPASLAGFSVAITVSYARPATFLDIQARVTVPEGTTAPVRLYWIGESTLPSALGYATPDGRTAGAFTVLGTTPASYQVHGMEVILGEGFQYLVGPAACPYAAVAVETCPGGSGFVATNQDLPNLISDVPGAPVALALEYGPLAPGRTTVGFRLAFRTQADSPLPTTTLPPPVTPPCPAARRPPPCPAARRPPPLPAAPRPRCPAGRRPPCPAAPPRPRRGRARRPRPRRARRRPRRRPPGRGRRRRRPGRRPRRGPRRRPPGRGRRRPRPGRRRRSVGPRRPRRGRRPPPRRRPPGGPRHRPPGRRPPRRSSLPPLLPAPTTPVRTRRPPLRPLGDPGHGLPTAGDRPTGARSDDAALVADPVAVLEQALVELARGEAGQLVLEVDRRGGT